MTEMPEEVALALRPREAARRLNISERTLWALTKAGRVPHIKLNRAVLYPVDALRAWLAERAGIGMSSDEEVDLAKK